MSALRYLVALLVLVILWQIGALLLGERVLPAPLPVLETFFFDVTTAEFQHHVWVSFARVTIATVIGFALAFPLGILLGASRRIDAWVAPLVFLTYPVPKILFLPVLLVLFGLGETPKILLIALTVGYQILVVTRDSVRNLDNRYINAFASLSRSRWLLARHVLAPASLPHAVTSLRIATGTAIAVLFLAESFATNSGLGFLIMDAWGAMNLPRMFAGIIAMSLLGLLLHQACNALERIFCAWARL